MTDLDKRIAEFRDRHYYNDGSPYGGRRTLEGDLKAEILWAKANPPKTVPAGIPGSEFVKTTQGETWVAALDTLLRYLEEK